MQLKLTVLITILFLGHNIMAQEVNEIVSNLFYYRPGLATSIKSISKNESDSIFINLKKLKARDLNYIGYHLLSNGDKNAIPILIEFMNPEFKKDNETDANYYFTWTILQRIISDQFVVTSNDAKDWYNEFKTWWVKGGKDFKLALDHSELNSIFNEIKKNEDTIYRKNW